MDMRAIRTEADYDWALAEIEPYFEQPPEPNSPEADRFDILAALVKVYEDEHHPIDAPDPVATIQEWMARRGLRQRDLADLFGSKSRASEVLNRKRPLTMEMVFRLSRDWGIPAEALIAPYDLAA
ncbi:MAG: XRE family transcriptional regulator [Bosea sp. (in: a-proteobacteria)]|uniref:helix-turn-helix domain-containing protein n=1 Tax=Bosea sp. (in: a-proteobacteria) TaxID=1871050 RepID=UPI00273409C4|nr:XRE family transcriptional regulator [Bosea sp. (in: a-proteobacteria)]MDP3256507.1 XRE family transcriptional regulator [Bosea sp. (in: a-proteobacteria)]MDP3318464.1 XRE family transcriptional regulator [Bosea sp. (in: a-proteobacteria)]